MKIKYKFLRQNNTMSFEWENEIINIEMEKENTGNLNKLYDFIIENINDIEFEETTKDDDKDDSIAYKASELIIKSIEEETKIIKKECEKIII